MANWIWPDEKTIFDLHDRNIDEFGVGHGTRDINVIKSAIATPKDLALYEPNSDAADLAARYAYHKETFDVLLDVANNDMTREQLVNWYRGRINKATKGIKIPKNYQSETS